MDDKKRKRTKGAVEIKKDLKAIEERLQASPKRAEQLIEEYVRENPSSTRFDVAHNEDWYQNFIEWVDWKYGLEGLDRTKKPFRFKKRIWSFQERGKNPEKISDLKELKLRLTEAHMYPEQKNDVKWAYVDTMLLRQDDEKDFGAAKIKVVQWNRKSDGTRKGGRWITGIRGRLNVRKR